MQVLPEREWRARRAAHQHRVDAWIEPHRERRRRGERHAVHDFLFTYYSYRPAALRRWHPGVGVVLEGSGVQEFAGMTGYVVDAEGARLDLEVPRTMAERTRWIRDLLAATADRQPLLGCFGLHEWAMVYRQRPEELRHSAHPLRLGHAGTDAVVEQHRITCTHFDAFRFFTDEARPRNVVQPTRETQATNDQPGCLHATMDLYKWAYQLAPFTPSELVADCFALAKDVRQVDMAAAPYDLSSLGVEPIRIETAEGKAAYIAHQRGFAARGRRLRERLIEVCASVLAAGPVAVGQSR
ncbi:MAG: 3-methyladenine DNA glycosylase [Nocardioidaceae bacterium]